jgi:hypothetical protein
VLGIVEEEEIYQSECDECGGNVESDGTPAFLLEDECALCFECALRRGGHYDFAHAVWFVSPDLTGLVATRRPLRA